MIRLYVKQTLEAGNLMTWGYTRPSFKAFFIQVPVLDKEVMRDLLNKYHVGNVDITIISRCIYDDLFVECGFKGEHGPSYIIIESRLGEI